MTGLPRNAPEELTKEFSETFRDANTFNKDLEKFAEKASADYNPLDTWR